MRTNINGNRVADGAEIGLNGVTFGESISMRVPHNSVFFGKSGRIVFLSLYKGETSVVFEDIADKGLYRVPVTNLISA